MKKVFKLTESDLTKLVERVIKENEMSEDFGGFEGNVIVSVEGEGLVKRAVVDKVRKSLKYIGGDITLKVDGEEIPINPSKGSW